MKKSNSIPSTPGRPASPAVDIERATPAEQSLHNNFVASARVLRRGMARTLYYLLAIKESKVYVTYGFSSLASYAEHHGGLSPRTVAEMLTLARRMQRIPELADAVQLGRLTWRKALLISRRTMESNPRPLIELAEDLSYRELQKLAAKKPIPAPVTRGIPERPKIGPGADRPHRETARREVGRNVERDVQNSVEHERDDRQPGESQGIRSNPDPVPESPIYVTLKMTPEQYAVWESATAGPGALIDRVLGTMSGRSTGQPRHLIVMLSCPRCDSAELVTGRGDLRAPATLLQRAMCDGVVEDEMGTRRSRVPERRRRAVLRRARYRCEAEGCENALWLEVHHRLPVGLGGDDGPANLVVLCSSCHRRIHEREHTIRQTVQQEPG